MKNRIVIFIHALVIISLQFIPNTIASTYYFGNGEVGYDHFSFVYDISHLLGMGLIWYPPITIFSFVSLFYAIALLIWDRRWLKITIISTSGFLAILMLIPISLMIIDVNRFSIVQVLMFILLISEIIITAVSFKRTER